MPPAANLLKKVGSKLLHNALRDIPGVIWIQKERLPNRAASLGDRREEVCAAT